MDTIITTCTSCGCNFESSLASCPQCRSLTPAPTLEQASVRTPLSSYVHSGKFSPAGLPLLILSAIIGGIISGVTYHYLANLVDAPVIFAIGFGMVSLMGIKLGMKASKCRNARMVVAAGALAGFTMYLTRQVADSQEIRPQIVSLMSASWVDRYGVPPSVAVTKAQRTLTPLKTLEIYLKIQSVMGVTITSSHSSSYAVTASGSTTRLSDPGDLKLTGLGYWSLLIVELLAATGVAGALAKLIANAEPFCEDCDLWMPAEKLKSAYLHARQSEQMLDRIEAQDWAGLMALRPSGVVDLKNYAAATLHLCPRCQSGVVLASGNAGHGVTSMLKAKLSPASAAELKARTMEKFGKGK
jgi:hypothetical protein